ncbi:hypothetical protein [Kordiimonas pumila]|uniref:Uncharacterized protein n=1 Tax=Kordiimonas pumila TaxID=2161677 RepID=A0ABV7D196_9PROT|nr:hypothetical protein [Kordiimonas pumila]
MTNKDKNQPPAGGPPPKVKSADKQARLAEALRANLRRRKEQSRERKTTDGS